MSISVASELERELFRVYASYLRAKKNLVITQLNSGGVFYINDIAELVVRGLTKSQLIFLARRILMFADIFKLRKKLKVIYNPVLTNNKQLPSGGGSFTRQNVNSGYTIGTDYSVIYRKEELGTILIHELLHQIGIYDKKEVITEHSLHYNQPLRIDEAIVETHATILNAAFTLCESNVPPNPQVYYNMINQEMKYAAHQSAKILAMSNGYVNSTGTAVYEYYIIRAALLQRLDLFLISRRLDSRWHIIQIALNNLKLPNLVCPSTDLKKNYYVN